MVETCTTEDQDTRPLNRDLPAPVPRSYLLTGGIAKCGLCGRHLEGKPGNGKRSYSCIKQSKWSPRPGCGGVRIATDSLDDYIAVQVLDRLNSPRAMAWLRALASNSTQTGIALTTEIGRIEGELRELGRDMAAGRISKTMANAAAEEWEAQLAELRRQARNRVEDDTLRRFAELDGPDTLARFWEQDSTLQQRHDLIKLLVDEIRIHPTKRRGFTGFQPERVEIVWAAG